MQPSEVIFSPNAEREIKKLNKLDRKSVMATLKRWRKGDENVSIEKLRSQPDFFRIRAGNIRIVYYPLSQGRVVLLLIRDRKDIYKVLGNLPSRLETAIRKLRIVGNS